MHLVAWHRAERYCTWKRVRVGGHRQWVAMRWLRNEAGNGVPGRATNWLSMQDGHTSYGCSGMLREATRCRHMFRS